MAYLTAEWEKAKLLKTSNRQLQIEATFLYLQLKKKCDLLEYWGFCKRFNKSAPKLPDWMIQSDIKDTMAQLERVMAEIRRREIP